MDQVHDNSHRTLIKIAEDHELPAYVREHDLTTKDAAAELEDSLFADEARRQFPVESPANTWLSSVYFAENGHQIKTAVEREFIEGRIKRAAEIHGITVDLEPTHVKVAAAPEPETLDESYCWLVKDASGTVVDRGYPVFDERGLKKAMDYFGHNRNKYPMNTRREISLRIMDKAASYGVTASDLVMREAGFGIPHRPTLMDELLERAKLCKDAEAAAVFANLNEVVSVIDSKELLGSLDKFAENLDALDRLNDMTKHYGVHLMAPADVIFAMTMDKAAAFVDDSLVLDRYTFSLKKIAELPADTFDILGDDFSAELTGEDGDLSVDKLAAVIPTLPRPDKAILEEHIISLCA